MEGKEQSYDDEAMRLILERGAELDRGSASGRSAQARHSAEEIVAIARDAGISEASVRAALAETRVSRSYSAFFGGPKLLEARAEGPAATDAALVGILDRLPSIARKSGRGRIAGGELRWEVDRSDPRQAGSGFGVEVNRRGAGSEVVARNDLSETGAGLFGGSMSALALAVGLGSWGLGAPALLIAVLSALSLAPAYLLSRLMYRRLIEKSKKDFDLILESASEILERYAEGS